MIYRKDINLKEHIEYHEERKKKIKLKFQIRVLKLMYGHGEYGIKFHFLRDWTPRFSIRFWRCDLDFTLHLHWDMQYDSPWFKAFWQNHNEEK